MMRINAMLVGYSKIGMVRKLSAVLLALALALSACNAPAPATPTPDIALVVAQTQTAIAVQSILTAAAGQVQPPAADALATEAAVQTAAAIVAAATGAAAPGAPAQPATQQPPAPAQPQPSATPLPPTPTNPPAPGLLNQGAPAWSDSFEGEKSNFYLGADDDIEYAKENGDLLMTAFEPIGDMWRVAETGYLSDFYLEAQFSSDVNCSGKDGYGLIFRARDQGDNIVDSGYIFGVSCDGKYRLFRMDDGKYVPLVNWTEHPAIAAGANKTNTLAVQTSGSMITLVINNTIVMEFADGTFDEGYFGLTIRSENTKDLQIKVHQVQYWVIW